MIPNISIAIDGSWDHPRNGAHCLMTSIDMKTKKLSIISWLFNYEGSSNGMKTNGTNWLYD